MQPLHWLLDNSKPTQITSHQLYQYLSWHFWLIPSVSLSLCISFPVPIQPLTNVFLKLLCSKAIEFSVPSHSVLPLPLQTIPQMISLSLPHHFCLTVQVVYCYVYDTFVEYILIVLMCGAGPCYDVSLQNIIPCTFDCTVCSLNSET